MNEKIGSKYMKLNNSRSLKNLIEAMSKLSEEVGADTEVKLVHNYSKDCLELKLYKIPKSGE